MLLLSHRYYSSTVILYQADMPQSGTLLCIVSASFVTAPYVVLTMILFWFQACPSCRCGKMPWLSVGNKISTICAMCFSQLVRIRQWNVKMQVMSCCKQNTITILRQDLSRKSDPSLFHLHLFYVTTMLAICSDNQCAGSHSFECYVTCAGSIHVPLQ